MNDNIDVRSTVDIISSFNEVVISSLMSTPQQTPNTIDEVKKCWALLDRRYVKEVLFAAKELNIIWGGRLERVLLPTGRSALYLAVRSLARMNVLLEVSPTDNRVKIIESNTRNNRKSIRGGFSHTGGYYELNQKVLPFVENLITGVHVAIPKEEFELNAPDPSIDVCVLCSALLYTSSPQPSVCHSCYSGNWYPEWKRKREAGLI